MDIFNVLTLVGGLCLFLFGMNLMGQALERRAGGKLRSLLDKMTSRVLVGFLTGLGITAIIQSSSATTVMVVGFVNSGLMTLRQAINVIMGANVGTTVTAWLLSLAGIDSGSLWIRLLKPSSFTPVLALVGIIFYMFCKDAKKKDTGTILLGFATLMFGMETMSGAVAGLKDVPEFTQLFLMFRNPVLGVLVGAVLTGIIQSSSASVGILQALSVTGSVSYAAAIPIIMGQNIGTCVTALLSSIGVNKNAKRVSIIHISFNLFGTAIGLVVYCIARYAVDLTLFNDSITPVMIAVFHSIFNIATTIILLPFSNTLVKIAKKLVTTDNADGQVVLDERLLLSPGLAVKECLEKTNEMAELARDSFKNALDLFDNYSDSKFDDIEVMEEQLDYLEDQLDTFLIHLSGKDVSEGGNNEISKMLHAINDFERIGDHAINMAKLAKQINDNKLEFSKNARKELTVLNNALREILTLTVEAFSKNDLTEAVKVEPLEQVIDDLTKEIRNYHIERLQKGKCDSRLGVFLTDYITNCERASDHCSNIAVCLIQTHNSSFETHDYLNELKAGQEPAFVGQFTMYQGKYHLDEDYKKAKSKKSSK